MSETTKHSKNGGQLRPWDSAEHLSDPEVAADYLNMAAEEGDVDFFIHCLGQVARARGIDSIAAATGQARSTLYQQLSEQGNPTLRKLMPVLQALGLSLTFTPTHHEHTKAPAQ